MNTVEAQDVYAGFSFIVSSRPAAAREAEPAQDGNQWADLPDGHPCAGWTAPEALTAIEAVMLAHTIKSVDDGYPLEPVIAKVGRDARRADTEAGHHWGDDTSARVSLVPTWGAVPPAGRTRSEALNVLDEGVPLTASGHSPDEWEPVEPWWVIAGLEPDDVASIEHDATHQIDESDSLSESVTRRVPTHEVESAQEADAYKDEWATVESRDAVNEPAVQALATPLVENLIERGRVHLLSGLDGAGKTTLAIALMQTLAGRGSTFLGQSVCAREHERMLLLSVENGYKPELLEKYGEDGLPLGLHFLNDRSAKQQTIISGLCSAVTGQRFRDAVDDLITLIKHNHFTVVVIDHAQGLIEDAEGMNTGASAKPLMKALGRVADATGAAVFLIGHHNKGDHYEGHTAFATMSRVHISISRINVITVKSRTFGRWSVKVKPIRPDQPITIIPSKRAQAATGEDAVVPAADQSANPAKVKRAGGRPKTTVSDNELRSALDALPANHSSAVSAQAKTLSGQGLGNEGTLRRLITELNERGIA